MDKNGPKLSIGSKIKDSWEGSLKFLQFIFIDVFMVTCEFHWVSTMFKQKNNKLISGTIFLAHPVCTYCVLPAVVSVPSNLKY